MTDPLVRKREVDMTVVTTMAGTDYVRAIVSGVSVLIDLDDFTTLLNVTTSPLT